MDVARRAVEKCGHGLNVEQGCWITDGRRRGRRQASGGHETVSFAVAGVVTPAHCGSLIAPYGVHRLAQTGAGGTTLFFG
jgi:hypothetical protein